MSLLFVRCVLRTSFLSGFWSIAEPRDNLDDRYTRKIAAEQDRPMPDDQRQAIGRILGAPPRPIAETPLRRAGVVPGLLDRHGPGRGLRLQDDLAVLVVRGPQGPAVSLAHLEPQDPEVLVLGGQVIHELSVGGQCGDIRHDVVRGLGRQIGTDQAEVVLVVLRVPPIVLKSYHQSPLKDRDVRASRYSLAK